MLGAYGRLKPPDPIWQPGSAPAGCKAYYALTERAGPVVRDASGNKNHGVLAGTPAWQAGPCGAQIGGFSSSSYVVLDPRQQMLGGVYPCWAVGMAIMSTAATGDIYSCGNPSNSIASYMRVNANGVAGRIQATLADDAVKVAGGNLDGYDSAINGGKPFVLGWLSRSASAHSVYLNGAQIGAYSTTLGTVTAPLLTLGVTRYGGGFGQSLQGSLIAAAFGFGAYPDMAALAQDWLGGRFKAVRPRRREYYFASGMFAFLCPPSIPSAESFGAASLASSTTVTTTAIPSTEAFGAITTSSTTTVTTRAIPSAEAFGTVNVGSGVTLAVATIPSAESFGAMSLATATTVVIDAIPSEESFGDVSAEATATVTAAAIPSEESFGSVLVFGAVPSSLYPVARRLPGQPDPKRTKIKYL